MTISLLPLDEDHNGYCMTCHQPAYSDHDGYSECCNDRVTDADEIMELLARDDTLDAVDTSSEIDWTPGTLRGTREALGLSRAQVSKVTGLSSSVVWRSEQVSAKPITSEQLNTLIAQYVNWKTNGIVADIKPRAAAAAKIQKTTDVDMINEIAELEKQVNALNVESAKHFSFIQDLLDMVQDQLATARTAKRATKDLRVIEDAIAAYLNK